MELDNKLSKLEKPEKVEKPGNFPTCSEVDNDVNEKNCVRHTVKNNPSCGKISVEERNSNWKNDQKLNFKN